MSSGYQKNETSSLILSNARKLFEKGGSKAFSYKDLSTLVGIKTSSIHYYFPTKQDLVHALVVDYREELLKKINAIDQSGNDSYVKIGNYIDVYIDYFRSKNNVFLDIMLVSSYNYLDTKVQEEISKLYTQNIDFIARLLKQGKKDKVLHFEEQADHLAQIILSSIQGAAILSKVSGNESELENIKYFIERYIDSKNKGFISKYLSITR